MSQGKQGGFTLIEAAVAIAVVAVLAGIIIPLVVKNIQDSQYARAKNDISVIAAAVANQIKDTGCRPSTANGPNGANGTAYAVWGSTGTTPANATAPGANNTFANLFTTDKSVQAAQDLFFPAAVTANAEFSYRGPYMASDVASKSDPWGSKYLIAGYNANGQSAGGHIWVVSCGPDKATTANNIPGDRNPPAVWEGTAEGEDDIIVQVQ